MLTHNRWFPLQISEHQEQAAALKVSQCIYDHQSLDAQLSMAALAILDKQLIPCVPKILQSGNLGKFAHLLNGWGNFVYNGQPLLEGLTRYLHPTADGRLVLVQCDYRDGEMHPWQLFAYASMAGVDWKYRINSLGLSLQTLASQTSRLNTDEGIELGHFLFAVSSLNTAAWDSLYTLKTTQHSLWELMAMAETAHWNGAFRVCRKTHLTEGICAAAARIPQLLSFRPIAQTFLEGQLDVLKLLATELYTLTELQSERRPDSQAIREVIQLRHLLGLDGLLENHLFYAGHLIEVACFAALLGYHLEVYMNSVISRVFNTLNRLLLIRHRDIDMYECFVPLAHYRRALTLFSAFQATASPDLSTYVMTPDAASLSPLTPEPVRPEPHDRFFATRFTARTEAPLFTRTVSIIKARSQLAVGFSGHNFQQFVPSDWPRGLHYELLATSTSMSMELHIEGRGLAFLSLGLRSFAENGAFTDPLFTTEWDGHWYSGRGRLICAPSRPTTADIAECCIAFIAATKHVVDAQLLQHSQKHYHSLNTI